MVYPLLDQKTERIVKILLVEWYLSLAFQRFYCQTVVWICCVVQPPVWCVLVTRDPEVEHHSLSPSVRRNGKMVQSHPEINVEKTCYHIGPPMGPQPTKRVVGLLEYTPRVNPRNTVISAVWNGLSFVHRNSIAASSGVECDQCQWLQRTLDAVLSSARWDAEEGTEAVQDRLWQLLSRGLLRCWRLDPDQISTGKNRKLSKPWHEPYRVVSHSDTGVVSSKVCFPEEECINVHLTRTSLCPVGFPNKFYWYGRQQSSSNRLYPRAVCWPGNPVLRATSLPTVS